MRVLAPLPFAFLTLVLSSLSAACVSYHAAPIDPVSLSHEAATPPPGPMTWDAAVRWALEHNPDLLALRARAVAAGAAPAGEPIELEAGTDNAKMREAMVTFDALSILGIGVRGAEKALARARRCEAWMKHHQRAREIVAELAEACEIERAVKGLPEAVVELNADAYVKAGLESGAASSAASATAARLEVEDRARGLERLKSRLAQARLLGYSSNRGIDPIEIPPAPWPTAPESGHWNVFARGEVQQSLAAYEVADREFAKAVAEQYPALVLSPGAGNDPLAFFGHVGLRLPFGATEPARAAEAAREAARLDVLSSLLDAQRDAQQADLEAQVAAQRLGAARVRAEANVKVLAGSKARLQATGGSFMEVVFAADAVVDAEKDLREMTVDEVRTRIRAARAAGWPGPEVVR